MRVIMFSMCTQRSTCYHIHITDKYTVREYPTDQCFFFLPTIKLVSYILGQASRFIACLMQHDVIDVHSAYPCLQDLKISKKRCQNKENVILLIYRMPQCSKWNPTALNSNCSLTPWCAAILQRPGKGESDQVPAICFLSGKVTP
jgi:hypothetical protein